MDPKITRLIDGFKKLQEWGVRGLNTEIARRTGFSASYIGQIFKKDKVPAVKFLNSVCDSFGINRRWVNEGEEPILSDEGNRKLAQRQADFEEFGKTVRNHILIRRSEYLEDSYNFLKTLGISEVCIEGFKELQKLPESTQYRAVAMLKEMNQGNELNQLN